MPRHNPTSQIKKNGFTAVEVLIIAPIVILVIGAFITVIVNMTGAVLSSRGANTLAYTAQDALNQIEQDVKSSNGFLATNNITLTSPQGYDNVTAMFDNNGTNGPMLILSTYATTTNPLSSTRNIIYTNSPNTCASGDSDQNNPMSVNIIYFVKNGTLWRRTIMPSNYTAAGCAVPWQQPTCTTVNGFCTTKDTKLVDGILATDGFNISYYSKGNATNEDPIANNSSSTDNARAAALQAVNTVKVTISATNRVAGRDVSYSGAIRATIPSGDIAANKYNSYQNTVLADNPVGYWSLNETSDTTAADISGGGYTGTYNGGVVLNQTGALSTLSNHAALFTGPNPTRITTVSNAIWNRINGQSITVEAWIKPNWSSGYRTIIANRVNISTTPNWELYQHQNDGSLQFHGSVQYKGNYIPPNNTWTYVVATVDSAGSSKLYINGIVMQTVANYTYYLNAASTLIIGAASTAGEEPYSGTIDEVAIYNKALTAAEIAQHYAARTLP